MSCQTNKLLIRHLNKIQTSLAPVNLESKWPLSAQLKDFERINQAKPLNEIHSKFTSWLLFQKEANLPDWFISSYKIKNPKTFSYKKFGIVEK